MENCFIICRQSAGENDPDESLSIAVQVEECKKLAASHSFNVVQVFRESNTSGRLYPEGYSSIASQDLTYTAWCRETKKTEQWRKGLGEMLKRIDEVQWIVCYDLTRFFRPLNGSFLGNLLTQTLQAHGVKLLTIKEGVVDFSKFQDLLISSLTSQINSEQLRTQIEKSKAAYKRLRDAGEYYPGLMRVHGYKKTGRKLEVVIDEDEAVMVREVFKMYNNAVPVNVILRHVNTTYGRFFKGDCKRAMVTKMIQIPAYCGLQRNSSGELVKCKQLEGKEIVSIETWMKANKKLDAGKTHLSRPKKRFLPLSGYIYCGHCGGKMKATTARNCAHSYYVCFKHVRTGAPPCGNNMMGSAELKEGLGLLEAVKPLLLAEALKRMKNTVNDEAAKKDIAKLDLAMNEADRKMKKLTSMWMDGTMAEDVYDSAVAELKQKSEEMAKKKRDIEMSLSTDTTQFDWAKLMMKFKGDALSKGEYVELATTMLKKIVVYKDFIEVKTTYGDCTLPRQKIGRYNLVCNCIVQMRHNKAAIYFYRGKAALHDSAFWRGSQLTAVLDDVEIFTT